MKFQHQRGFSLIELIIAIAIVGILVAVALPSYQQYVQRSNRADAKTALLMNAQFLERNFTESNHYCKDSGGNVIVLPHASVPASGTSTYAITVACKDAANADKANVFLLTATPRGSMANDACANLTLDQLGVKGTSAGSQLLDQCWNR